jgi:hypothetical protein
MLVHTIEPNPGATFSTGLHGDLRLLRHLGAGIVVRRRRHIGVLLSDVLSQVLAAYQPSAVETPTVAGGVILSSVHRLGTGRPGGAPLVSVTPIGMLLGKMLSHL